MNRTQKKRRMQVVLRLDAAINTAVRAAARQRRLSINAFCQRVLARAVGVKETK